MAEQGLNLGGVGAALAEPGGGVKRELSDDVDRRSWCCRPCCATRYSSCTGASCRNRRAAARDDPSDPAAAGAGGLGHLLPRGPTRAEKRPARRYYRLTGHRRYLG